MQRDTRIEHVDRAADHDDETDVEDAATTATAITLRWIRRVLPFTFLALVTVLAIRELRGLDLHAVRTLLHDISLSQLLVIQLTALAGILAMSLYVWRAAQALQLGLSVRTLPRSGADRITLNRLLIARHAIPDKASAGHALLYGCDPGQSLAGLQSVRFIRWH